MKNLIMLNKRRVQISGLKNSSTNSPASKKDPKTNKTINPSENSISITATEQIFITDHVQLYSEKITVQSRAVKGHQAVKRPQQRKTVTTGRGGEVHSYSG